jgi:hypothetical protein
VPRGFRGRRSGDGFLGHGGSRRGERFGEEAYDKQARVGREKKGKKEKLRARVSLGCCWAVLPGSAQLGWVSLFF